ncbi:MAG TPA: zinc-ribbon domain-containing protein [Gemmatimonadaceae bacterium]|nr:zinc-ribbon domain-containing protein [Gemmatimonadaceae bacterium]
MALIAGFAIALGAAAWVLAPLFRRGAAAAPPPACPSCGERPELDARFCSNCGRALSA